MAAGQAQRSSWRKIPATSILIAVTSLLWLLGLAAQWSSALLPHAGFVPERLAGLAGDEWLVPAWLTPLTALFVHAGFLHLAFNMIALLVFGRSVEPAIGTIGLLLLYIVGAFVAAGAFFLVHPVGLAWIGAGGGVGAVLGAYAILFGRGRAPSKAHMARWSYTLWLCVGWILLSLLLTYTYAASFAVYYAAAYIASFVLGLLLGRFLLLFRYRKA